MTQTTHTADTTGRNELIEAIEALTEGFALFDQEDALIFCNSTFRSLTAPASSILEEGLPWAMFEQALLWRGVYSEVAVRRLASSLERLAEIDDGAVGIELDRGERGWHQASLQPTLSGGFVVTLKDISEQKSLADAHREAETLLRRVFDASPANLMIYNMDADEYLHWTPAWEDLLGKPGDRGWADPSVQADLLTDLLATGTVNDFDTELTDRSGNVFPARVSARLTQHNGDKVWVSAVQDMTTVYAQRDEIVRLNQRLFDAIAALDQGFALFDADARLVVANELYDAVNAPIADCLKPGIANARIVAASEDAGHEPVAAGWPGWDGRSPASERDRFEFSLPDGRQFLGSRMPISDGGFVVAWLDISEQRAAERELDRQRERSFQNEKLLALGELLAGVAHELNNPLSVVVGQALMLREEVDDPDRSRRIDKISMSAERCSKIVKTFLAMARQKPAKLESVSVNAVVETALDVAAHGIRSGGATVTCRLGTNLPPVRADEDQITQVLINLLANAEHAIAEKGESGRVDVETAYDGRNNVVVVRISDNGPGVPEHLQARIFEPFFTTKPVGEGTGVGLALCHRIVDTHGGRLELQSMPDSGATFSVQLPPVGGAKSGVSVDPEEALSSGLKALVIEDEADVAEIIGEMLNAMGVEVEVALSAEQGLAYIADGNDCDLILSDVKMPGLGGYGLLGILEAERPEMLARLGFLTGDAMSGDAEKIRSNTTRPLIEKPVSPPELRRLVQELTGSRNWQPS